MPQPVTHDVEEGFVVSFARGVQHRAEQKVSRLRGRARVESGITGTREAFDFIGASEPTERTARHADTKLSTIAEDRRWVSLRVFEDAKLVGRPDQVRRLNDPMNPYSTAIGRGMGRKIDRLGIEALGGAASFGGSDSGTPAGTVAFPAANEIGTGALQVPTVEVYLDALAELDNNEEEEMDRYVLWTPIQRKAFIVLSNVSSTDFAAMKALQQGTLTNYLGAEWIAFGAASIKGPAMLPRTGDLRDNWVYQKESLLYGFGTDVQARITERPDKNYDWQVWYHMDFGAVRLSETGVYRVKIDETA